MPRIRRNPFLSRSMIRAVDQFYGRRREVGRIMARIGAQPPQSVSVVGERRVGKSSLLWHLAQADIQARYLESPENYLSLLLDFQGQQHLDLEGFCRVFGHHLDQATGERLQVPELKDLTDLEEVLQALERQGLRLVCLFDEFETVTRNPGFGPEFFGFLRSVANGYPVAFVTSSRQELERLCHTHEISESPFFNIFAQVRLGSLTESEARELIALPSEATGVPLEGFAEQILELSGRLPFFLQIACSAAFEYLVESGDQRLNQELVEQRFLEEAGSHFHYLWERFATAEREVVGRLAVGAGVAPERELVLKSLEEGGYVERDGGARRLFSQAFAHFLQKVIAVEIQAEPVVKEIAAVPISPPGAPNQVEPVPPGPSPFPQIIGGSEPIRQVFALMQKALSTDATVLLTGETGTGKELVARTIHQNSLRRDGPFITVNCGALAEHLQESELFGHKKGAFTDAVADREGLFEAASGGSLFLDEIGDTSPSTQVKLLRTLQEGEVRRVGESTTRKVDVRLIGATNRNLELEVAQGRFREDLYYRLYVLVLLLPPLRERPADIPLLIAYFLEDCKVGVDQAALDLLQAYGWPGNIRELENQLASARAMAGGETIQPHHLWGRLLQQEEKPHLASVAALKVPESTEELTLKEARDRFEKGFMQARLQHYSGNLNEAARSLGLSRSRLYELIRRYDLNVD